MTLLISLNKSLSKDEYYSDSCFSLGDFFIQTRPKKKALFEPEMMRALAGAHYMQTLPNYPRINLPINATSDIFQFTIS